MKYLLASLLILGIALGLTPAPAAAPAPATNAPVDRSVRRALEYLSAVQDADGAWRGGSRKNAGVSALCIMAFLSAGQVPGEGEYAATLDKGIRWVMSQQRENGLIATDGNYEMYHHGICTLMLAEVCGMTQGSLNDDIRARLVKAVNVILKGQRQYGSTRGGWRYQVAGNDADISVTGWQLMALRAAKNLGCDVPPPAIDSAVEYIQRCFDANRGGFCYQPHGQLTIPCTGTSVLGLELCGRKLHRAPESLRAGAYILKNPPKLYQQHCFYGLYYCSQAMFQLGDNYWLTYRTLMHDLLLNNQSPSGAWIGQDGEGRMMGPHYTTSMGVLALTVEYRYLPIYQRGEEPEDKDKP